MTVTIELRNGPYHDETVTQEDLQRNIGALEKVKNAGGPAVGVLVFDSISILKAIQKQLPKYD